MICGAIPSTLPQEWNQTLYQVEFKFQDLAMKECMI